MVSLQHNGAVAPYDSRMSLPTTLRRGAYPVIILLLAAIIEPGCVSSMAYNLGHSLGSTDASNQDTPQAVLDVICVRQPNGCGPHGILGDIIPDCPFGLVCFASACNEHDICYTVCGTSKVECDREFHDHMTWICADEFDEGSEDRERCIDLAYVYWQVVERYAQVAFDNGQVWACACGEVLDIPARTRESAVALTEIAAPFDDVDDDLMPDDWELHAGLDPADPSDALGDADGDGLLNLQEFVHGMDPCQTDTDGDGVDDRSQVERTESYHLPAKNIL